MELHYEGKPKWARPNKYARAHAQICATAFYSRAYPCRHAPEWGKITQVGGCAGPINPTWGPGDLRG